VLCFFLKGIGKEFQQLVIRRYLEKSVQKKLFLPFTVITNKDYFFKKFVKFTGIYAVYVIYIYGRDVIAANCNIVCIVSKYCLFIS